MKKILFILTFLFSTCMFSQEVSGYVIHRGEFHKRDSSYSHTNISGTMFTFEKMIGKLGEKEFIRIGVSKNYGKTYHDFEIKAKSLAKDSSEYNMYVMETPFKSRAMFMFNDEDFFVFFVFDENYGETGVWMNYYKGIFFTKRKDGEK